jgi:hypothetical protein
MSDDEDTYQIPLQDQRIFGAGIKRQRVRFVPSSSTSATEPLTETAGKSISDRYLSLVLSKEVAVAEKGIPSYAQSESASIVSPATTVSTSAKTAAQEFCDVCRLPLLPEDATAIRSDASSTDAETPSSKSRPHEASLAHQVCLTHSHPPSHLDRNRKGLAYLSAYGWDPDARVGLGVDGQGIQFPIKPKPKDDKLGIGVVLPKEGEIKRKEKVKMLDAGKVRKLHDKDRKKSERLREMFYRNDDVERYLNGG